MTRYRSGETGRYVTQGEAALDPVGTVSEALPAPVDLEAGAEAFYRAWVMDGPAWVNLSQSYRDRLRHALKNALSAL